MSGAVLRYRDLDFLWATRFRQMLHEVDAVLEPAENIPSPNQIEIIASMLHDDEEHRGVVTNSARIGEGYALVRVINNKVEGLANAPDTLIKEILAVSSKKTTPDRPERVADVRIKTHGFKSRRVSFTSDELILGGQEHKDLLEEIIRNARSFVVIHSTFVNYVRNDVLLDRLETSARSGVRIDILWGKSDAPDRRNSTRDACEEINKRMRKAGLEQFIRAHHLNKDRKRQTSGSRPCFQNGSIPRWAISKPPSWGATEPCEKNTSLDISRSSNTDSIADTISKP